MVMTTARARGPSSLFSAQDPEKRSEPDWPRTDPGAPPSPDTFLAGFRLPTHANCFNILPGMASTFVVSRSQLIYALCLPLAVLIGYFLAEPLESGSMAIVI